MSISPASSSDMMACATPGRTALTGPGPAHEAVDELPVAQIGGDPPGRGVGMREVSPLLQERELVADRGRRHLQPGRARQLFGGDRRARADIAFGDGIEDRALSFCEYHRLPASSGYDPPGPTRRAAITVLLTSKNPGFKRSLP